MNSKPNKQNRSGCDKPVPVASCLQSLAIGSHAAHLAQLNRQVQRHLPAALAGHATLANIRDGCATFVVASPARAARTRLQQGQLRDVLQAIGLHVNSIEVRVVQPERAPRERRKSSPLTGATAAHLRAVAASMPDPELRDQYLALASLADNDG